MYPWNTGGKKTWLSEGEEEDRWSVVPGEVGKDSRQRR